MTRVPSTAPVDATRLRGPLRGSLWSLFAPILLCLATGCATTGGFTPPWKKASPLVDTPKDSLALGGRGPIREPIDPQSRAHLDAAQRLFQEKKYAEAEALYHQMARTSTESWWNIGLIDWNLELQQESSGKRIPRTKSKAVYEEALFFEAECQFLQKNYRDAANTYTKLLVDIPQSQYTQRACKGLFAIAHHWLEPTRRQMKEYQAQLEGERWFVTPAMYVHFSKEMPFLDAEGHATNLLNTVRLHDINGPLGEQSLFYLGTINFFRKEYKEADFYFSQLYHHYPNSEHAATAIKQSVICKQLCTGGSVYDLRTVEESKKLLLTAQGAYPELVKDEKWVETQLKSINIQQADRDFKIAEFYERTGHPGSAYFYYELVNRRYPGTTYATRAEERKNALRGKTERQEGSPAPTAPVSPMLQPGMPVQPFIPPPPRMLPPDLTN